MNRLRFTTIISSCVIFFSASLAYAGPWTPDPGGFYQQTAASYFHADEQDDLGLNIYGELGIGNA